MIAAVPLTARQAQAMDLVVAGRSNGEISARMDVSIQRVTQLLAEAYEYYDAPNRVAAAIAHRDANRRTRRRPPRVAAGQGDLELA